MQEPWLLELHKKLWKQESLRSVLFRTAQVTRAHYSELQTRLHAAHPTRNSKTYQAAQDVSSVKLDILQNFVPSQSSASGKGSPDEDDLEMNDENDPNVDNIDDPEVNDEGHFDIRTEGDFHDDIGDDPEEDFYLDELFQFLPATIQYVDITPLRLQNLPRIGFPVLLRDEYKVMSALLDSEPKDVAGSCLITGQPSAGKTCYLYVLLIERLLSGKDTIFQSKEGNIYEVSNTVRELPPSMYPKMTGNDVLALVDADGPYAGPSEKICGSGVRIIVTSSPKDEKSRGWMKQLPGGDLAKGYMINPFSLEEFLLTGIFLHPVDVTYARLNAAKKRLGNNPRCCFYASVGPSNLKEQVHLVNEQISAAPATTDILTLIYDIRSGGKFSHRLFQIYPRNDRRMSANCYIKHVSEWSFQKLLEKYEERQSDAAREIFNLIRKEPEIASINGVIWERQCHMFFRSLRSSRSFTLRSLDDPSTSITWEYPGSTSYQTFESGSFATQLQARINDGTSVYLKPVSTTFPTLDSLVYCPRRLDFLQMTVDLFHPRKTAGFERIQRWLNLKGSASHLRASKARPWIIIFIVPEEIAASFKHRSFGKVWDSKVKQYVLGLSQKDVWELDNSPL